MTVQSHGDKQTYSQTNRCADEDQGKETDRQTRTDIWTDGRTDGQARDRQNGQTDMHKTGIATNRQTIRQGAFET